MLTITDCNTNDQISKESNYRAFAPSFLMDINKFDNFINNESMTQLKTNDENPIMHIIYSNNRCVQYMYLKIHISHI